MTRINSAISPKHLTDEHLLAEHREIKRLPYCLAKAMTSGSINRIPKSFALGRGHVTFFLDKMEFIRKRYNSIREECLRRGFSVEDYSGNFENIDKRYCKDYNPTIEEREMLLERISQRINESPKSSWHYHGKAISKEEAINILKDKDDNIFN